ncbi:glutathione S-transferase family protein [Acidihalobacter prosperus]
MTTLFHFWSSPESQRVRLALGYKQVSYEDRPLEYQDDETFFELGLARTVPVLQLDDGRLLTGSSEILFRIDELFPDSSQLVESRINLEAWEALLAWRQRVRHVLERLYAPIRPAYRDIGEDPTVLRAYKADIENQFGMPLEALANDRYDGYAQLRRLSRLDELSRHLARSRFYMGKISIADLVLTADLYPIQLHDGLSLPIDMMYYLQRVSEACDTSLATGLLAA